MYSVYMSEAPIIVVVEDVLGVLGGVGFTVK